MKEVFASLELIPVLGDAEVSVNPRFLHSSSDVFGVHSPVVGPAQYAEVCTGRTPDNPVGVIGGTNLSGELAMSFDIEIPVSTSRVTG